MKVICRARTLTEEQKSLVSLAYQKSDFHVTVGNEYLVFGLTIMLVNGIIQTLVQYVTDSGHLVHSPLQLFEISDSRVSKYWKMKINTSEDILFWPPSFYQEYYHDDLFENILEVRADFTIVRQQLEEEFM